VAAAKTMKPTKKTKQSAYHKQTSEYTHRDVYEIRSPTHAHAHPYSHLQSYIHTYIPHVAAAEGTDSFLPLPFVFIYCFFL